MGLSINLGSIASHSGHIWVQTQRLSVVESQPSTSDKYSPYHHSLHFKFNFSLVHFRTDFYWREILAAFSIPLTVGSVIYTNKDIDRQNTHRTITF